MEGYGHLNPGEEPETKLMERQYLKADLKRVGHWKTPMVELCFVNVWDKLFFYTPVWVFGYPRGIQGCSEDLKGPLFSRCLGYPCLG